MLLLMNFLMDMCMAQDAITNNQLASTLLLVEPTVSQLREISDYVKHYQLDGEGMQAHQFVAVYSNEKLVGFGRVRTHNDCRELCTLAVVKEYRGKGVGSHIVRSILEKAGSNLYLTCIIPDFFSAFGFTIINSSIPDSMQRKRKRCSEIFPVKENYFIMYKP